MSSSLSAFFDFSNLNDNERNEMILNNEKKDNDDNEKKNDDNNNSNNDDFLSLNNEKNAFDSNVKFSPFFINFDKKRMNKRSD